MSSLALLIECDPGQTLGGSCLRDVNNMAKSILEFNKNNIQIVIFTTNLNKIPKFNNITYVDINNLSQTIQSLQNAPYEIVTVLISGHGYTIPDQDGDEISHMDDAIYTGKTYLSDDIIYDMIVKQLKCKNMLLLSDTCHSGTMFDLPYLLTDDIKGTFVKYTNRNDVLDKYAISISACSDQQLSMCDIGDKTGFGGSLTTALLNIDNCLAQLTLGILSHSKQIILGEFSKIKYRLKMLNQIAQLESSLMAL